METNNKEITAYSVKASSHIITLLGDELIGSNSLALFELVKNSYDADASFVRVHFENLLEGNSKIIIEDDGVGMSVETLSKAWLTIGTDYKRQEVKQSKTKHRTSLGNKGVGRLAVHRLANNIMLETKITDSVAGSRLSINWNDLIESSDYIEGMKVNIEHAVNYIPNSNHGTKITLYGLRDNHWTRAKVVDIVGKLMLIQNPFNRNDDFKIIVSSNESKVTEWIESVRSQEDFLDSALFRYKFNLMPSNNGEGNADYSWNYQFYPKNISVLDANCSFADSDVLSISNKDFPIEEDSDIQLLKNRHLANIGTIEGEFYVFMLDNKIITPTFGSGSIGKVKDYVASQCGIKVFRDNIRVYNYGEPTDDWLGLDQQKMRRTGNHFAKGQTVGAINLNLKETKDTLVEKTNREGFIENETFSLLVSIVRSIFNHFERITINDREKVRAYIENINVSKRPAFSDTIEELYTKLQKRNLDKEFAPIIKRIKHDYNNMREVMLGAGMSGLNLSIVFHELVRELGYINTDINKRSCDIENIKMRVKSLMDILEKFSPLMKKNNPTKLQASTIIEKALGIHKNRLAYHKINLEYDKSKDFPILVAGGLVMSALSNIIDNAIYWVCHKREKLLGEYCCSLSIKTDLEHFDGPAIVVADNGEGFMMNPEDVILPFRTLKPNGMGVGLYYVSIVMEMSRGKILFVEPKDAGFGPGYTGACVVLVFPNSK